MVDRKEIFNDIEKGIFENKNDEINFYFQMINNLGIDIALEEKTLFSSLLYSNIDDFIYKKII